MRKFFPAANTPYGFVSNFCSIYNEKEDKKVIFIKGGSGTGKSTLMKKLSEDALGKGYEIEQFFCSSDPDSLDGVRFLDIKTAIVDATAPHVQDPLVPGITSRIYNIADFWNEELLILHRDEIFSLIQEKKKCFDTCYRYLKAAKALYFFPEADDYEVEKICSKFKFKPKEKCGKTRCLFASGITPKGNVNLLNDILVGKIIGIEESNNSSEILKRVNLSANAAGYDTELYYCPILPDTKAEHLVIKDLEISFTTLNDFHTFPGVDETICSGVKLQKPDLITNLIDQACNALSNAKQIHGKIEKIYISAMDFKKMDNTYEHLKNELL